MITAEMFFLLMLTILCVSEGQFMGETTLPDSEVTISENVTDQGKRQHLDIALKILLYI